MEAEFVVRGKVETSCTRQTGRSEIVGPSEALAKSPAKKFSLSSRHVHVVNNAARYRLFLSRKYTERPITRI